MRFGNKSMFALGRLKTGQMNKTEALYSAFLNSRLIAGEIIWFKFEAMKLRLADLTFYTPDFSVMLANGELEQHEVKGFMMDDANVKIKMAEELYPFRFYICKALAKKLGGGFSVVQVAE